MSKRKWETKIMHSYDEKQSNKIKEHHLTTRIIIIILCIYIAPIQKLNSALSALHILLPWQTCSFFKLPSPLRSLAHIHTHTQTRARTYTHSHSHNYTDIHTHTQKVGTFSTSREAFSAMLPFYRRSALIHHIKVFLCL